MEHFILPDKQQILDYEMAITALRYLILPHRFDITDIRANLTLLVL